MGKCSECFLIPWLTFINIQRIEEIGYDRDERYYFVLDDNRLYRRTDPAPPPPLTKPKVNSKKGRTAARASKRRKTNEIKESANEAEFETVTPAVEEDSGEDDGLGGRKWECIAVTLGEYQAFLETINKSRNFDEKALHRRITEDVLSVIEKAEESQWRKKQKQEREVSNMHKLATAKRSSRLEAKQERERQEHEAAETERKRKAGLAAAKQDLEQQKKMEEARESRMLTREQRLKEREFKRVLHEEELTKLSEENKKVEAGEAKRSERYLKTEMEKHNKDLAALAEDDEWIFDCSKCAKHGTNFVSLFPLSPSSRSLLTKVRTMALIASPAKSAMSGSTVHAWVSHRELQRKTTSISSAMTAYAEQKMP